MRKFGLLMVGGACFLLASVALVEGQQGKGKGGFGGIGGFRPETPFDLLNRDDVKKELDVSTEQLEKLPEEMLVAISHVLDSKQFARFKQLRLQRLRNNAFKDKGVQKQLNLTSDQTKNIESVLDEEGKALAELRGKGGFGGGGKGNQEKSDKVRSDAKEKIYTVLTKDQRKAWREMLGDEFKFAAPAFGGGAFGKGKTKKKTDQ